MMIIITGSKEGRKTGEVEVGNTGREFWVGLALTARRKGKLFKGEKKKVKRVDLWKNTHGGMQKQKSQKRKKV
jgi:hypothetical protein